MKTEIKVASRTKLFSEDVAYFEANVNYTIIHYYQGKNKIVATTIGQIHERIGEESVLYGLIELILSITNLLLLLRLIIVTKQYENKYLQKKKKTIKQHLREIF